MARCEIRELYKRLLDDGCVCYIVDERRQTLRQLSSFALWVKGFSEDVKTAHPRWTPKEKEVATADTINRSEDDKDEHEEVASCTLEDISPSRCLQEGGMAVDETAKPESQCYEPDVSPSIISLHTQSKGPVRNSPIVWQNQEGPQLSSFSSCQDRLLLCLTVGKELFEAETSCEGVVTLQQEMTSRGLLDDVGLLMKSHDRLVAFMACKMMAAVLLSSNKETVTTVLRSYLQQSLATINACHQSIYLVGHAGQNDSNQINPHNQTQEVNQGQLNPGQVSLFQLTPGQVKIPPHTDPSLNSSQGHDTSDQVRSRQAHMVKPDQDLSLMKVNPGQVNHAVFTFDLSRRLMKRFCMDSPHWKESHVSCHSQRCKRRVTPPTGVKVGDNQGFQAEVLHLLYTLLPDLAMSFVPSATERDLHSLTVGCGNNKTTLLILASFLDLIHALFKGGPEVPQWHHFTFKILPLLIDLLKTYYNDLIVLKKLLDILTVSMNQLATGMTQSNRSQPSVNPLDLSSGENVPTVATSFVDLIVDGNILDDIPYRSGAVGFGGGDFDSSSGDDVTEDAERGDRTLLRKVCRVTLSCLKTLVAYKHQHSEVILDEADVSKCFQTLSVYICSKLNLPLSAKPPIWIFKLFADQDDSLIWVMLCLLSIHRSLCILDEPLYSSFKDQLNPHKIFVGFLETIAYDPSVLLDLLISSETSFLEYLVQYLHAVIRDWEAFCHSHKKVGCVVSEQVTLDENNDEASDDGSGTGNLSVCTSKISVGDDNREHGSCVDTERETSPKPKRRKRDVQRTVDDQLLLPQKTLIKRAVVDQSSDNSLSSPTDTNKSQPNKSQIQLEEDISMDGFDRDIKVFKQELEGASSQSLEDVMTTLIRLRFLIERISGRDLFPYPIGPLLRLLERVEDMYDDMGS